MLKVVYRHVRGLYMTVGCRLSTWLCIGALYKPVYLYICVVCGPIYLFTHIYMEFFFGEVKLVPYVPHQATLSRTYCS